MPCMVPVEYNVNYPTSRQAARVLLAACVAQPCLAVSDDPVQGHTITVVGEQIATPQSDLQTPALSVHIDERQIQGVNALNVEDSFKYAPSLIVRKRFSGDNNATLSFRGSHTTQTPRALVSIDGFNISNFLDADFVTAPKWALLAPGDVASVDIIYGPMSARYSGHTLGGGLMLKTREITTNRSFASAQRFQSHYDYYGTDETLDGWSIDAGVDRRLGERGGVSLSYRHFENQGQPQEWRQVDKDSLYADQAFVDTALGFPLRNAAQDSVVDSREDQLRLRGHYQLNDNWRARTLIGLLLDEEDTSKPRSFLRDETGQASFVGISGVSMGLRKRSELLVGLGLEGQWAGWNMDLAVSRFDVLSDKERRSSNFDPVSGLPPVSGRLMDGGNAYWNALEWSMQRTFGAHAVTSGLSWADYGFDDLTYNSPNWLLAQRSELRDRSGGKTRLAGLFVEDTVHLAPAWLATAGLRLEHWQARDGHLLNAGQQVNYPSRSESAVSPKLSLRYQPHDRWSITASSALSSRFPTVGELYQADLIAYGPNVGELDLNGFNPALEPERATDLQLIAAYQLERAQISLSVFRQSVDDTLFSQSLLIPSASDPEQLQQASLSSNIDQVVTDGVELILATHDLGLDGLQADFNLAWLDAEVTKNALNPDLVGNTFPRVPRWRSNAQLRYSPSEKWLLAAGWRYQSTPYRNIENTANAQCQTFFCVSKFSIVDVKITRHWGDVSVSAGIDNLTDERAFVFHPYSGRSIMLQLNWQGDHDA